jgi:hypothetical protein
MKPVTSLACAALFALGSTFAHAGEGCRSGCAGGYTWSSDAGICVPKTVSS